MSEKQVKKLIYVCDDDKNISELIKMYLENDGFEVETFNMAEKLLNAVRKKEPNLITLDIMLPGMDGFETLVKIREKSEVPIILVSAKDEEIDQAFEYTNDIIHILNSFDTVAIYFINKIADVEIAFSIMASPYVEFFDTFYPIISSLDDFQKNASYKLYIMWSNKLENMKNHELRGLFHFGKWQKFDMS